MKIIIESGKLDDIDEIEQLYNDLNDYQAAGVNYVIVIRTFAVHKDYL